MEPQALSPGRTCGSPGTFCATASSCCCVSTPRFRCSTNCCTAHTPHSRQHKMSYVVMTHRQAGLYPSIAYSAQGGCPALSTWQPSWQWCCCDCLTACPGGTVAGNTATTQPSHTRRPCASLDRPLRGTRGLSPNPTGNPTPPHLLAEGDSFLVLSVTRLPPPAAAAARPRAPAALGWGSVAARVRGQLLYARLEAVGQGGNLGLPTPAWDGLECCCQVRLQAVLLLQLPAFFGPLPNGHALVHVLQAGQVLVC